MFIDNKNIENARTPDDNSPAPFAPDLNPSNEITPDDLKTDRLLLYKRVEHLLCSMLMCLTSVNREKIGVLQSKPSQLVEGRESIGDLLSTKCAIDCANILHNSEDDRFERFQDTKWEPIINGPPDIGILCLNYEQTPLMFKHVDSYVTYNEFTFKQHKGDVIACILKGKGNPDEESHYMGYLQRYAEGETPLNSWFDTGEGNRCTSKETTTFSGDVHVRELIYVIRFDKTMKAHTYSHAKKVRTHTRYDRVFTR